MADDSELHRDLPTIADAASASAAPSPSPAASAAPSTSPHWIGAGYVQEKLPVVLVGHVAHHEVLGGRVHIAPATLQGVRSEQGASARVPERALGDLHAHLGRKRRHR